MISPTMTMQTGVNKKRTLTDFGRPGVDRPGEGCDETLLKKCCADVERAAHEGDASALGAATENLEFACLRSLHESAAYLASMAGAAGTVSTSMSPSLLAAMLNVWSIAGPVANIATAFLEHESDINAQKLAMRAVGAVAVAISALTLYTSCSDAGSCGARKFNELVFEIVYVLRTERAFACDSGTALCRRIFEALDAAPPPGPFIPYIFKAYTSVSTISKTSKDYILNFQTHL